MVHRPLGQAQYIEVHLAHLGGIRPAEAFYNQRHPVIAPLDSIGWNQYHWEQVGSVDLSGARVEEMILDHLGARRMKKRMDS